MEKTRLLNQILNPPVAQQREEKELPNPIIRHNVWPVRRNQLETQAREAAELMRIERAREAEVQRAMAASQSTEQLEKELLGEAK